MDRTGPPDDAYGRVTDASRYEVLGETAEQFVAALDAAYQVEIQRGGRELDPELCDGLPVDRVVRLEPARTEAAPITIVLTTFPGSRCGRGDGVPPSMPRVAATRATNRRTTSPKTSNVSCGRSLQAGCSKNSMAARGRS